MYAMRAASQESRAEDYVGLAFEDGRQQRIVFTRIVFQIGILDNHIVPGALFDRAPNGRPLALVPIMVEDLDIRVAALDLLSQQVPRSVGRAIVHEHDRRNAGPAAREDRGPLPG